MSDYGVSTVSWKTAFYTPEGNYVRGLTDDECRKYKDGDCELLPNVGLVKVKTTFYVNGEKARESDGER